MDPEGPKKARGHAFGRIKERRNPRAIWSYTHFDVPRFLETRAGPEPWCGASAIQPAEEGGGIDPRRKPVPFPAVHPQVAVRPHLRARPAHEGGGIRPKEEGSGSGTQLV